MTASEDLRRMLDELGVEWWPLGSDMTECVVDGVRIKYRQVGRGLIVSTCTEGTVTTEQAIAATLGSCKCTNSERTGTCQFKTIERFIDARRSRADMCECDRCGYRCARGFIQDERFRYCPNCGRRIVGPLRELALGLKWCSENYGCENSCPLYDKSEPEHCREERLLRELGIEVDDG